MQQKPRDICNKILVVVNIVIFLILDMIGDPADAMFMYKHGAMYPDAVLQDGEWYRLIAANFMHFNIRHVGNNMLILFFLGDNLERALGHIKYVILYLCSGLAGSLISLGYMAYSQKYAVSAGASGAVFGVTGALIYVLICNRGKLEDLTAGRMIFMAILSLYQGFAAEGTDNFAHLGGLISGILLAMMLYRKKTGGKNYE